MMQHEQIHLYEDDIYAYLVVNQNTFEILDYNHLAKEFYFSESCDKTMEDLFVEQDVVKAALENFGEERYLHFFGLTSVKDGQENFICDIEMCFPSPEEPLVFVVIKDKKLETDQEVTSLLDLHENPVVILENDENFTLSYANFRFYQIIRKTPQAFRSESSSSCIQMLSETRRAPFLEVVAKQLELDQECNVDMELHFDEDLCQLFLLNAFQCKLDGKLYGVLIRVKKQSDLMKKIELDQQFFDIMQEFSKDLLFHIEIKKQTMSHRGDVSSFVDLLPIIENFPESIRQTRLIHPDDLEGYIAFAYRLMSGLNAVYEVRFQLLNGSYDKYRLQGKVLFDVEGTPVQVVGKSENIQKYVEIENRANYDALTTTLNKLSFRELVEEYLSRAVQTDKFALLFLDFDDFKGVNDKMGHKFGDFLLEVTGKRIINSVRNHDRVGRVGGDEFVIFFHHAPNKEAVQERADAILHTLRRPFNDGELSYQIHASIGVSFFPEHGKTFEELYDCADVALYRSKALGKNVATLYSTDLKEEAMEKRARTQQE